MDFGFRCLILKPLTLVKLIAHLLLIVLICLKVLANTFTAHTRDKGPRGECVEGGREMTEGCGGWGWGWG